MSRSLNKKTLSITVIALAVLFFVVPHKAAAFSIIDIGADFVSHFLAISYEVFILPLASGIMYLAGILFDAAVQFSLHTAYIFKLSPAINLGWVIVRDLSNMFFIFILIFISLGTIINGTRFGTMNMLKNVVIAALFINFSLFLTKAAVDVSNIFGNWLYGGINKTLVVNSVDRTKPTSLSGLIANRLGIINLWKVSNHATGNKSDGNWINNPGKSIIGASLRLIIVLITIYIFIYCAILFLARSVTILFLLIFSPIAFMGLVLPQLKKYANQWLDELWNAMLFPVMFLLVLYISLQFINSLGSLGIELLRDNSIDALGMNISVSQYFQYFIIIFLLHATLKIAKENSGAVGQAIGGMAESLAKMAVNVAGTYATGGITMGIRALGRGAGAAWSAESGKKMDAFKSTAKENIHPFFTDAKVLKYVMDPKLGKEALTNKMKSGTWDVRNIGGEKTNLGSIMSDQAGLGVDLKGKSAKDIKADTAAWAEERKIEEANTKILSHLDAVATQQLKLDALKAKGKGPGDSDYDYIANQIKDARSAISDETQKLGNKELEKLNKKALKNEEFIRTISEGQVSYLADKADSDADKAKIWKSRLSSVRSAVDDSSKKYAGATKSEKKDLDKAVNKAAKTYTDQELSNLPPEVLKSESFVNPEAMDYDKFDKLIKSNKLTASTKAAMKEARYKALDNAIDSGNESAIDEELGKLEEGEIAKLGFKKDGKDGTRLSNPHIIKRLTPKVLGKLFDELSDEERTKIKEEIGKYRTLSAPGAPADKLNKNLDAVEKWFKDNNIGKQF